MDLSKADFNKAWIAQGEDNSMRALEVAWRRYQQVQSPDYETIAESNEPTLGQLEAALTPMLQHSDTAPLISSSQFVSIPSNTMPWKATGLHVAAGGLVSTFATGRLWRSRLLDLFLPPQFTLYFRVGVNGRIFNSTRDTNTFQAETAGELYLAPQFPSLFADPQGGRVHSALKAYSKSVEKGACQVLVVVWKDGVAQEQISNALSSIALANHGGEDYGLVRAEAERLAADYATQKFPQGWQSLWFLGENEIYSSDVFDGQPGIRCCPDRTVGIIQKHFDPAIPFSRDLMVSWDWCITALPSRLREDTTISHDYLSLAFEFENGRDLTYTWSWELPKEHGYWCPLPTWEDREYHVVIRSGTEELGQWLGEERNLYADYQKYIGRINFPTQLVRVWLIAGNWLQRHKGEMLIRNIVMGDTKVL